MQAKRSPWNGRSTYNGEPHPLQAPAHKIPNHSARGSFFLQVQTPAEAEEAHLIQSSIPKFSLRIFRRLLSENSLLNSTIQTKLPLTLPIGTSNETPKAERSPLSSPRQTWKENQFWQTGIFSLCGTPLLFLFSRISSSTTLPSRSTTPCS